MALVWMVYIINIFLAIKNVHKNVNLLWEYIHLHIQNICKRWNWMILVKCKRETGRISWHNNSQKLPTVSLLASCLGFGTLYISVIACVKQALVTNVFLRYALYISSQVSIQYMGLHRREKKNLENRMHMSWMINFSQYVILMEDIYHNILFFSPSLSFTNTQIRYTPKWWIRFCFEFP